MAINLSDLIRRLSQKSRLMAESYSAVKAENDKLREYNEDLQAKIKELQIELDKSRLDNEYLKVSHKIAPTVEDVKTSQKMIAELVRNIDKCISQLKE